MVFIEGSDSKSRIIRKRRKLEGISFNKDELVCGEFLGSGGFGRVYHVVYRGKSYAMKQWHKVYKNQRSHEESFQAEASIIDLRHPNIVRTLHALQLNGFNTLIMEYGGDQNLQELINNPQEVLKNDRQVRFALDIARGLAFAHTRGIAHLDLKPSNVLVGSTTDQCKIGDFGCCQNVGGDCNERPASPTKSSLTGTFAYRAPELLKGECVTTEADIYSFGICLWQMLTRDRPYSGENQHVMIFAVVAYQHRPVLPSNVASLCQTERCYVELMTQCWQSDARKRPTARSIARTLKHWQTYCTNRTSITINTTS